jgi:hypothetical protein
MGVELDFVSLMDLLKKTEMGVPMSRDDAVARNPRKSCAGHVPRAFFQVVLIGTLDDIESGRETGKA